MLKNKYLFASSYLGNGAVSFYRSRAVTAILSSAYGDSAIFNESGSFIKDIEFLTYCDNIRLQRVALDMCTNYFDKVKALSNELGFSVITDYDDIMFADDFPDYNEYKDSYKQIKDETVKHFMEGSDIVTVTTDVLAQYYSKRLNLDIKKFKVIDNYLPAFWGNGLYDTEKISKRYSDFHRHPRILISCSSSHFCNNGLADNCDDFDSTLDWIIANKNKYEFFIQGGSNKRLRDCGADIKFVKSQNVYNYLYSRDSVEPLLYIQPLKDCIFNRCKSAIKLYEADKSGIPILLQDIPPYQGKTDLLFTNGDDLNTLATRLFSDKEFYMDQVKKARDRSYNQILETHADEWVNVMKRNFQK